jgi:cytochrome c553
VTRWAVSPSLTMTAMCSKGSHQLSVASQCGSCHAGNRMGVNPKIAKTSSWVTSWVTMGLGTACPRP